MERREGKGGRRRGGEKETEKGGGEGRRKGEREDLQCRGQNDGGGDGLLVYIISFLRD